LEEEEEEMENNDEDDEHTDGMKYNLDDIRAIKNNKEKDLYESIQKANEKTINKGNETIH